MKIYDEDLTREAWRKRVSSLPAETQLQLKEMSQHENTDGYLLLIKRKRPKLERGDVFVVQPEKDLYFYGRVLNADVDVLFKGGPTYTWKGSVVVCLYRSKTRNPTLEGFEADYDDLLVKPCHIVPDAFYSGYLYKIGNVPLTEEEVNLDYGLFNSVFWYIEDEYGNILDHMPRILGSGGLGHWGSFAAAARREMIIDPGLLDTDGLPQPGIEPIPRTECYEEEAELSEDELAAMRTHTLEINARLMPFDRGDVYEDSMDEALVKLGVGCVVGSGTYISDAREPTSCDIEIELAEDGEECLERLKEHLLSYEFPKGTVLHLSETEKLDLGTLEGLALYLNGTELPEDTYRDHDADEVAGRAAGLLGEAGRYFSCWTGPAETALYFYGKSFKEMKRTLRPLVKKHPLCRKCRVVRIA